MHTRPDARHDQLKILKLERRTMRPLGETLLSNAPKSTKRAAIAAAALAVASLSGAPEAYAANVGVPPSAVSACTTSFTDADAACARLLDLVSADADQNTVFDGLRTLYTIIDTVHARLNRLALAQGARLFRVDEEGVGTGGEDKDNGLGLWLTQLSLRAR